MLSAFARRLLYPRRIASLPATFSRYSSTSAGLKPPESLSEGELGIYNKLTDRFTPSQLQVQDVSGGCGTFYAIVIASEAFTGLSTVKQHRLVTETLKSEIEGIHGLQVRYVHPL
ncbi:hypothetical protein AMATHDRAFT_139795 [Amanita thiersii Skay4041]|uniref:Bola-like protein n=1 Tax=Amanita thiersii Skay4041 TaxID=703135 RepID=A0A2A9NXT6_9AGAR|nr:hypothetical protein AMATHDRAFT_139795 [Amanita thiersii Skay4041]